MYRESRGILDRLSIDIPSVRQPVDKLSGGQRQAVAVGRAVAWGNHIVVLDEPTAALGVEQTRLVLDLIERLKKQGVAVLLVSHNMHDVIKVCDRVVVLRHGMKIGELASMEGITPPPSRRHDHRRGARRSRYRPPLRHVGEASKVVATAGPTSPTVRVGSMSPHWTISPHTGKQ